MSRVLARHPLVLDWWPVLLVPGALVADAGLSSYGRPITVVNVLAGVLGCLPLAWRRRVSFAALVVPLVGGIVLVLWRLHPVSTVVAIPIIALFELAQRGDRRRSWWMGVATVPCVIVSVLPFASGFGHVLGIVVRNAALCLLAIAVGEVLRSRQVEAERTALAREQETLARIGEERLRIAREIHDLVAHAMTAINVQAGVAAHLLERDPRQVHGALRSIKDTSGAALTDLRATLGVLRDPAQAAPLRPAGALRDIAELTGGLRAGGVEVEVHVDDVDGLPSAVRSAGYRIVQEALTNVARHAAASRAGVSVRRVPGAVILEVVDDGVAAAAPGEGAATGNGLRGMRERAAALGGTVEAGPVAGGGWRVRARLPVGPATGGESEGEAAPGADRASAAGVAPATNAASTGEIAPGIARPSQ